MLMKRIQPQPTPKPRYQKAPEPSSDLMALINRMDMRDWLYFTEGQLIREISELRMDIKFIEHLPHCRSCRFELQLDIERYYGRRSMWYLCLENNEYLEEQYPDCPKAGEYRIDNYWAQVERYRRGIKENDTNTMEFIMDRARWAYNIMGNQIKLCRVLLRMVRNWDFSPHMLEEFNRIYDSLRIY